MGFAFVTDIDPDFHTRAVAELPITIVILSSATAINGGSPNCVIGLGIEGRPDGRLVRNVRTWPAMPREKVQVAPTTRPKVPMRRRGADCLVVVRHRF